MQVQYQHGLNTNADFKAIAKKPLTNAEHGVDLTVQSIVLTLLC